MRTFRLFVVIFLIGFQFVCYNPKVFPCGGSKIPVCGRTVWVAKFVPVVVLFPSTSVPLTVPVSVLPFASWSTNPACPQPTSATVSMTLTCTPALGGAVTTIGPTTFTVPTVLTPVVPGVQPLLALPFTIPAGTFPTLTPQICTVAATYTVTFSDSVTLTGTGDTKVGLIPPSSADPSIPELNMELIKINGKDFQTCRKGDQTCIFYLIENNDPKRSVTLTCKATTNQVAKMPVSDDPDTTFSLSDPGEGTDNFPIAFSDTGLPGEMIELPDPFENSKREVTDNIIIPPGGIKIAKLKIRSWGMCANGSCGETVAVYEGTWSDGAPALACAGTALLVDDVPAKSALCEIQDEIKSSSNANTDWSRADFGTPEGPLVAASTFFNGQLTSANLPDTPQLTTDNIRLDESPTTINFGANAAVNFPTVIAQIAFMSIEVTGFMPDTPLSVPLISFGNKPNSNLNLKINHGEDSLTVDNMEDPAIPQELFFGSFSEFIEQPPENFNVDIGTCRTFGHPTDTIVSRLGDTVIATDPEAAAVVPIEIVALELVSVEPITITILDAGDQMEISWDVAVQLSEDQPQDQMTVSPSSGPAGTKMIVEIKTSKLPQSPDKSAIGFVEIVNDTALNSPHVFPVAARVSKTGATTTTTTEPGATTTTTTTEPGATTTTTLAPNEQRRENIRQNFPALGELLDRLFPLDRFPNFPFSNDE